jgi:hypothetical protein
MQRQLMDRLTHNGRNSWQCLTGLLQDIVLCSHRHFSHITQRQLSMSMHTCMYLTSLLFDWSGISIQTEVCL